MSRRRLWLLFPLPDFGTAWAGRQGTNRCLGLGAEALGWEPGGYRGGIPNEAAKAEGRHARIGLGRALGRAARILGGLVLAAHLAFIASTSLLILAYARVTPAATLLMAYRRFQEGLCVKPVMPLRLADISPRRREMLVRIEDWNFYRHWGFDLGAIRSAWETNRRLGRPAYGGSTLSMQTARSLFLLPAKSYFRKYLEAIVTLELELILTKERILELYLSCAEWGPGVFGVQAASMHFYGRPVQRIDDDQYARLVALVASPVIHGPYDLSDNRILAKRYADLCARYLSGR